MRSHVFRRLWACFIELGFVQTRSHGLNALVPREPISARFGACGTRGVRGARGSPGACGGLVSNVCFGTWSCLFFNIGQFGVFWSCVAGPERKLSAVHDCCFLFFPSGFSERDMVWDGEPVRFELKWPRMISARMPKDSVWRRLNFQRFPTFASPSN